MILEDTRVLEDIRSRQYSVKIAASEEEVARAQQLRYEVFKEELDREFDFDDGMDTDDYDEQSHHLIVKENKDNQVIGTYRIQTIELARNGIGFVSEQRYHLEDLPDFVLEKGMEVGRACIRSDHRNGRVLYLLWKGFADYMFHFDKRFLFGYSALNSTDPSRLWALYDELGDKGQRHPDWEVRIREPYRLERVSSHPEGALELPPLLENYLSVGTRVCSPPSFDNRLGLAHFFILLDLENVPERTKRLFL
ncbi:MAG: GNAT family N-acetyltransferase [Bacteroidota bacterium]